MIFYSKIISKIRMTFTYLSVYQLLVNTRAVAFFLSNLEFSFPIRRLWGLILWLKSVKIFRRPCDLHVCLREEINLKSFLKMSFWKLSLLCYVAKISILFLVSLEGRFLLSLPELILCRFHTSSFTERKFKCGANDF